jgi:hypothetical protein
MGPRRPYSLDAFIGVLVSTTPPQRGQMNTCTIACSSATRADLDQAISTLQESQIGAASCSIDRLCSTVAIPALVMVTDVGCDDSHANPQGVAACPIQPIGGILRPWVPNHERSSTARQSEHRRSARGKRARRPIGSPLRPGMTGCSDYQGPASRPPTIRDALNAGHGYLEVRCLGRDH